MSLFTHHSLQPGSQILTSTNVALLRSERVRQPSWVCFITWQWHSTQLLLRCADPAVGCIKTAQGQAVFQWRCVPFNTLQKGQREWRVCLTPAETLWHFTVVCWKSVSNQQGNVESKGIKLKIPFCKAWAKKIHLNSMYGTGLRTHRNCGVWFCDIDFKSF